MEDQDADRDHPQSRDLEPRRNRRQDPRPVELPDRNQVQKVQEEADRSREQEHGVLRRAEEHPRRGRADRPGDRARNTDLGLLQGVGRVLALEDRGAQEGDEDRSGRMHALAPDLENMPHLVDEDHDHEGHRKPPAVHQRVGAEAHSGREQRGEGWDLDQENEAVLDHGPHGQRGRTQPAERAAA